MSGHAKTAEQMKQPSTLRRRGLISGTATLVAAMFVKDSIQAPPAAAATDGQALVIGTGNTSNNITSLSSTSSYTFYTENTAANGYSLYGKNLQQGGVGVAGQAGYGVAVQGGIVQGNYASPPVAVEGINFGSAAGAIGTQGIVAAQSVGTSSTGVEGDNYGTGDGRIGVLGVIVASPASTQTSGVTGLNLNTGPQAFGVIGSCDNPTGVAVQGQSTNGIGVVGRSSTNYGCIGVTSGASYGIYGLATAAGSAAFAGGNSNPNGYAAVFGGNVTINLNATGNNPNGAFIVTGGAKSAAVPHPDGTHRLLYCMESPESWFEDFGEATLASGKADVNLDADFAAVVDTSKMHIFFTEHGANHALHVANVGAKSFTVEADADALASRGKKPSDVSSKFSYRIVAKRKDIPGTRFATYKVPELKLEDPTQRTEFPFAKDRFTKHSTSLQK